MAIALHNTSASTDGSNTSSLAFNIPAASTDWCLGLLGTTGNTGSFGVTGWNTVGSGKAGTDTTSTTGCRGNLFDRVLDGTEAATASATATANVYYTGVGLTFTGVDATTPRDGVSTVSDTTSAAATSATTTTAVLTGGVTPATTGGLAVCVLFTDPQQTSGQATTGVPTSSGATWTTIFDHEGSTNRAHIAIATAPLSSLSSTGTITWLYVKPGKYTMWAFVLRASGGTTPAPAAGTGWGFPVV